jgi:hypothetical protein
MYTDLETQPPVLFWPIAGTAPWFRLISPSARRTNLHNSLCVFHITVVVAATL